MNPIAQKLREAADLRGRMTPGEWEISGATHIWSPSERSNVASASEPQGQAQVGYEPPKRGGGLHQAAHNATGIASLVNLCNPAMLRALADVVEAIETMSKTPRDGFAYMAFATAALAALTRASEGRTE